jgi:phosphatidylglycerophosphatase C
MLAAELERWLASCARHRDKLRIEPAIARLQQHLEAGDRVLVVTGAERQVAQRLWKALGGPEVQFVASQMRRGFGGYVPVEHCIGRRKLDALLRLDLKPPFVAMYSDSGRDLPLLRLARQAVLVYPDRVSLRRVRRVLPQIEVIG